MGIKKTILLTARSACAAWGILEVWRKLSTDKRVTVMIVSQEPATTIFSTSNVPVNALDISPGLTSDDENSKKILLSVKSILSSFAPDVALVGLSTPGEGGIDEAVIVQAECPTFMLQDFWGDSNLFFGAHPDYYLVMDTEAKLATDFKHKSSSIVVGSPRHAKYSNLDFKLIREKKLKKLNLSEKSIVHGFFCQPLLCPGYIETIEAWADKVKSISYDKIIYRPHPASPPELVTEIKKIFETRNLNFDILQNENVEQVISVCSTISSGMSNSNLDVAYFNYFSTTSMVVPIYLLFNKELVNFLEKFQKIDSIPTVKQEVSLLVSELSSLSSVMNLAVSFDERERLWANSKKLPNPLVAVETIRKILLEC